MEADFDPGDLPRPGELVRARQRQYLVSEVFPPATHERHPRTGLRPATLVKLVCLDDDAQGRELDVFWELEVGAERIDPTRQGLVGVDAFDPPARFGADYHALQWNCVTTATSPEDERVQAPFRAGIAIMQHQLVPLQKVPAVERCGRETVFVPRIARWRRARRTTSAMGLATERDPPAGAAYPDVRDRGSSGRCSA